MKSATIWSRIADVAGLAATPLIPAHYLTLLRPHRLQARIETVTVETSDVKTFTLRPSRGWRMHRPGQYVSVQVEIDGRLVTRMYSISSAPDTNRITITVKAQGRVSRALHALPAGAYITLGEPTGDFVLPDGELPPLLFITGGSGITPIASMIRTFVAAGELPDIVHLHFARSADDEIFGAELRALSAACPRYQLAVIHTNEQGRAFSTAWLDELASDWRNRETWACGPAGLLEAITAAFEQGGRSAALHVERFTATFAKAPANSNGGQVRFASSRVEARADGRTPLLNIAEGAGVAAPSGCRMGICHSCDTTLVAGCARDLRTGQLVEPGARVQLCVCAAEGDIELAL
jgi:ferredoxin-NADP reductase